MDKLKIGLIASVVLNVFLIGGIAGGLAFWRMSPHPQLRPAVAGAPARQALRFAADDLGPERQRAFRQALRQARLDSLPDLRQAQANRRQLAGLIGADSFDRAAVEQALSGARTSDAAVRRRLETAIVDFAAGLSTSERAVFVSGLQRSPTLRPAQQGQNLPNPATENSPPPR